MNYLRLMSPRFVLLFLLWTVPLLFYVTIGLIAIYQTGWLSIIAMTLPPLWLLSWLVSKYWAPPKIKRTEIAKPLTAPEFWTPQDAAAIAIVEQFRDQVADVDQIAIMDPNRYFEDAKTLTRLLSKHYHGEANDNAFHALTVVELLAVLHLSIEDVEAWVIENVPGSNLVTVGQIEQLPDAYKAFDTIQKLVYLASTIANPAKLLSYPLWRKSGRVSVELQNELITAFYQIYLRQLSYYLIEMYSGRLKGGAKLYRQRFGQMALAVHSADGDAAVFTQLQDVDTSIAVLGQVKAGKSSLINALIKDKVATTSVLPETREVKRYEFALAGSKHSVTLLDTPGYSEADVSRQQRKEIERATELADIVLLVLAANTSARKADLDLIHELNRHYQERPNLRPPPIIAVMTHIDLLRPVREWTPPYNWREPSTDKERSIAQAVAYARELFGNSVVGYACVYTGETHAADSSVSDEVIPLLVEHLSHGHSAAILKAFYNQLNRQRFQQLAKQVVGLIKHIGNKFDGR